MGGIEISKFMYETLAGGYTNQLPVSSVCNAKCLFCSNDMNPFEIYREGFRSLDDIKKGIAILDTKSNADIRIGDSLPGRVSEGEALLHPDIFTILKLIREKIPGRVIQVNTNGTLFTEEFIKELLPFKPMKFTISYHSDNPGNWSRIYKNKIEKFQIARNSFYRLLKEGFFVDAAMVPLPKLVGYEDIEKTIQALMFYVKKVLVYLPGWSKNAGPELKEIMDVDLVEMSDFFAKMRKKYKIDLDVRPDLNKPLNFDPYQFMIGSFNKGFRNVLWMFSEAAYARGKEIIEKNLPFVPNNHYSECVKNYTYEGNIICSGLLMVEDFRKALIKAFEKYKDQKISIDHIVLPNNPFDRFGDDLTGENYSKLSEEFGVSVKVGLL